jgi:hypothetical protein
MRSVGVFLSIGSGSRHVDILSALRSTFYTTILGQQRDATQLRYCYLLRRRAKFSNVKANEMRNINRRESPRIEIKLRCHVTSPSLWTRDAMVTENISRSGVLIAWCGGEASAPVPSVGQLLTVEIELPANHGFGQKCIHCQGTVMRLMSADPQSTRIALRVNYMDFRAFHDRIRAFEAMQPVASSWMA